VYRSSIVLCGCLAVLIGCHHAVPPSPRPLAIDFARPLPPGALALRKLSPDEYPSFAPAASAANRSAVLASIGNSLAYLARPASQSAFPYADITHDRAVATLQALRQLLSQTTDGPAFDAAVRRSFDVYQSIGGIDGAGRYTGDVQFTGYCTPIYRASKSRGGPYQFPIYRRPHDWVKLANDHVGRRLPDGTVAPDYYSRQQIEQGGVLAGQELAWLTSRVDAYVATVQGSARLRLPDGSLWDVGNDGTNGRPYASPGKAMVADGLIPADQLRLATLRAYFAAHPDAADHYLPLNERTAFFKDAPGGPFGKLGVPVTAFATIATDKSVYPAALPAFLDVALPTPGGGPEPFQGFMLDQDTGGAIRAAGRCDIYMGVGPDAERLSGQEVETGRLYYLAVRQVP
jgi:membrane-bound lytic murein transglycosylase A